MILLLLIPYDEEFANNIINDRIELITNALALLLIIVSILLFRQNNRKGNKSKLSTHKNTSKREILKTNKSTSMFIHIIKTSRIETSIISGVVVFVIMFSQNGGILNSVVSALIFTLITMFGFIVNDIYDYEKDKKAGVDRPIAKNLLPKSLALWSAQIIGIVSIFISLIYDSHLAFMVVLLTMFGLTVYSHISKYIPPIKGFITSILCLSPIIYSSVSANIDISIQIYLSLFIFILGREIFMDGIDFFGDKLSNLKTIPHYIGVKTSKNIGWIMMLLGSFLYINSQHTYTTAFISILSIFILISGYIFSKKNPDKGVLASRISMLLFALILPFSI
jgi:4-hydroxybenzoate polyprenyltransferase